MAIIGAHVILYSSEAEALRKTLGEILGSKSVDAGGGWLIFALPPSEVAVHPAEPGDGHHALSLMCDDLPATMEQLRAKGIRIQGEPHRERWGTHVTMVLPGDVHVMLYQPHHPMAISQ